MIDYSQCDQYATPVYLQPAAYSFEFPKSAGDVQQEPPVYHFENATKFIDPSWQNPNNLTFKQCVLDFTLPSAISPPIYIYYRLTNFYQNHRQYIKSYDANQLFGHPVSAGTARTNCDPLAVNGNNQVIYPCGLIANSMFNDTISNLTSVNAPQDLSYGFSKKGIAWPTDKQKYGPTRYQVSQIVPPPNWALRYPDGKYTEQYPPPDLSQEEPFMVWMHVAALHDFRKIWGRNDHDKLFAGRWRVRIDMSMMIKTM
ncbi:CDC50/LEM3 family [Radiomyces spectabilis]|uniref:CDC50/LEM3 family n=1 Tax=Radiomyces spectabilis TaxID=64574 RepID=UPI00221E3BFC|nr:CDC50/LEM3 family [Radiomyces spectabilis]KAI8393826.1 CDC50/LEM3 family [Radiomyces spectabilis]